ncbi:MAG: amino acid dehydrogenase [Defluviitaleaceae bacterium]|nr:amino acid dehydrogenase [Defluviitaleaceae bacterium]MCL2837004.1 amino acid dehydrogenase [Defluviitaleaceae bacterium]
MESIFTPLISEGLTALRVRQNIKTGAFTFLAGRDFKPELDFSGYNKAFSITSILTDDNVYMGTKQVIGMYGRYGLAGYLDSVLELIRMGKHMGMDFMVNSRLNIRFICGIHSDVRGRNNKSFTTFAGATRRHGPDKPELDVIKDALNLSRAMTFKNFAVNLPYGGCKTTLHMDPLDINNMDAMGFLAYACDTTHCITGPDMNLPKTMVKVMNEHFTKQYCGGPGSSMGDTAVPTALGAYLALKQGVRFVTGSESLDGMSVAVQGLGAVGYAMAENLTSEKTRLIITDVDQSKAEKFITEHPGHSILTVRPSEIIFQEADILCPCAMGGIIGEDEISGLKVKYVFGPANNQLRASSQDEEIRLAKLLAGRGILFQTEWWHNAAGVLGAAMEYIHGRDITVTPQDLERKVREIIPANTWENLNRAAELGITPTEAAYARCQDIIYA